MEATAWGKYVTGLLHHSLAVVVPALCTPRTARKYHSACEKRFLDFER